MITQPDTNNIENKNRKSFDKAGQIKFCFRAMASRTSCEWWSHPWKSLWQSPTGDPPRGGTPYDEIIKSVPVQYEIISKSITPTISVYLIQ